MSNVVSSIIFARRNIDKTQNGDIGRAPVAAAQCINAFGEISRYNKVLAKGTDAAVGLLQNAAKNSKALDYTLKGVSWATKHVNPMIAVSGVVKTIRSEDKLSTGITETSALGTMFAGEKLVNCVLEALSKCNFKNPAIAKIFNKNTKIGAIVHGVLFVAGSIASYSLGEYMGKKMAKEVKTELTYKTGKLNQIA